MTLGFKEADGAMLHDLLEHAAGDIVIRLNPQGFIVHASESLSHLGIGLAQSLFEPHVADLAQSDFAGQLKRYLDASLKTDAPPRWIEFPANSGAHEDEQTQFSNRRWFALSIRRLQDEEGEPRGGLGLLRSVDRVRRLEDQLFANALTDPFTGLVKRKVFFRHVGEAIADGVGGHLALFAIDGMRALLMQYGQRSADEINWGFAKFLQSMALPGTEVSQMDLERFAVMLPGMEAQAASNWANDVLGTFASLTLPSSGKSPKLSASAGLATIASSIDWTMKQAELALIMARAGGGNRAVMGGHPAPANPAAVANQDAPPTEWLGVQTLRR